MHDEKDDGIPDEDVANDVEKVEVQGLRSVPGICSRKVPQIHLFFAVWAHVFLSNQNPATLRLRLS